MLRVRIDGVKKPTKCIKSFSFSHVLTFNFQYYPPLFQIPTSDECPAGGKDLFVIRLIMV